MSALAKPNGNLQVAVIEGFHPFEVPQWHGLFRALEGIDYYPQHIENWAVDCAGCRGDYDVLLFYNMNMSLDGCPFAEAVEAAIKELGTRPQGLVFLHHALLAYPDMETWSQLVGIADRRFEYYPDQEYQVQVAATDHPITRGQEAWTIQDETYTMATPGSDSTVLLTTNHEKSMDVLAWTRTCGQSRVFCLQLGHDHLAWDHPRFREVLRQGIRWAARRI